MFTITFKSSDPLVTKTENIRQTLDLDLPITTCSRIPYIANKWEKKEIAINNYNTSELWHGTTILSIRKNNEVVVAGDGQVTLGQTIIKSNAKKVRRLSNGKIIAGFAGATADAFTLFERLEGKLEQHPGQLMRACVELAKDWRTDRYLRRLEAMMAVADNKVSLIITGNGDVLEPEDGIIAIGSGGNYALSAARAMIELEILNAEDIARKAMAIAAEICVYTNDTILVEKLPE